MDGGGGSSGSGSGGGRLRFQTTTHAAQAAALEQGRLDSRGRTARVQELQAQRERNTRTNLVLGTDAVVYESETAAGLRGPVDLDPGAFTRQRAMPAGAARRRREALQHPHFYLGDRPAAAATAGGGGYEGHSSSSDDDDDGSDEEEEGMYVPASRLPDPRAGGGAYRGELAAGAKARIQASSVHWGTEGLSYETTQRAFFHDNIHGPHDGSSSSSQEERWRQQREEIAALRRALTATHFRLEDGSSSSSDDNPNSKTTKAAKTTTAGGIPPVVKTRQALRAESSASHFALAEPGADPHDRQASSASAAASAAAAAAALGGGGVGEAERARARELRRELTASRIVLGADPAYM